MELRHLRYFVAVAEEESFTRAAVRLHLSQPPLSRQIRDLEEDLGIPLFEHGAKSVHLTEAGRVFLIEARAVLQRVDQAVQTAKDAASGKRGHLCVGYAGSLTVEVLSRILRIFHETNPDICVQLHDMTNREMLDGLRQRSLDIALLIVVSPKVPAELVMEELGHYPVCVALYRGHPLARAREVGLEQLAHEPFVGLSLADFPEHHAWVAGLFASFRDKPRIVEEHESATSLIAAVEAGRGVALVPQSLALLAGSHIKLRPVVPAPPSLAIGLARRKEAPPPAILAFLAAAKREAAL